MLDPFIVKGSYPDLENKNELNPDKVALIALLVQNFLEIMYDEIKRSGFSNLEFLEKCELFLRSVTSEYDQESFAILLQVFAQIDENFEKSKFFYGFTSIRNICTQNMIAASELTSRLYNYKEVNHDEEAGEAEENINHILVFANHLILNMIDFIKHARKISSIGNMTIDELRYYLTNNYNNCVYNCLNQIY